ncbi:MAG: exodeoxyribonuclease VII small subunit [Elainellaceae cyanobacterium]|jgi:exodeoxyribonuclease VII small subunit
MIDFPDGTVPPDRNQPLPDDWHYETTVAEVETIIEQIELGELELADVFEQFATAVHYLQQCEAFLSEHQQHMDLLIETLAEED